MENVESESFMGHKHWQCTGVAAGCVVGGKNCQSLGMQK